MSGTGCGAATAAVSPTEAAVPAFPFLKLPRELRDQIYNYLFTIPDVRGDRALRIERRHLRYFKPSAASFLLLLHHEYLLLNRQVAAEAIEVLLKNHTSLLSCGPYVLKTLLTRIEHEETGQGAQWLKWMREIELDWVTFPNLSIYPPNRENGKDEWPWEQDAHEVDVDYVKGIKDTEMGYNEDEYDYEGEAYDDNFYDPHDTHLYPSFDDHQPQTSIAANDPFGFAQHYPFIDPSREPDYDTDTAEELVSKLDLLVSLEVTPLFTYFASPTFALTTITLPLYFISKPSYTQRNAARPGYALPLKCRYWAHVAEHALLLLHPPPSSTTSSSSSPTLPSLHSVRVKYMAWDVWANINPSDDIYSMPAQGVWFADGDGREGEGEAFRMVWTALRDKAGVDVRNGVLDADVRLVRWEGNLEQWRVGDELEVVFTRAAERGGGDGLC